MKTLTLIDTFGFFFRSFYALPPLKSKKGFPTGLLTGFINFIHQLTTSEDGYVVFALDSEGPSFRAHIDPAYKAQRPEPPEDLKKQLPIAIDWISKMGFAAISKEGYEADDIIASLVRCAKDQGIKVKIVSHDKDLYQLIDDAKVVLYDPVKKEEIDEERAYKKFGVPPKLVRDYLALVGDTSDNIPGVKGIGPKTAAKLLNQFQSLEGIYEHIDEVKPERIRKLLIEGKEKAFLSKQLATLKDDLFDRCDMESYKIPQINPIIKIADELIDYDITAILHKIKRAPIKEEKKRSIEFETQILWDREALFDVIAKIPPNSTVAFDIETTSLDTKEAKLVGFSFAWEEKKGYYVPIAHTYLGAPKQIALEDGLDGIRKIFEHTIIGHNLKFDLSLLYRLGIEEKEDIVDTMILAWLVDPESSVGLDSLIKRYFDHDMIAYKETVKKEDNFSNVVIEDGAKYAVEDAIATLMLKEFLIAELRAKDAAHLIDEALEVEFPFINTLIKMEQRGIKLDVAFFNELLKKTKERLEALTEEIYKMAGSEFNINSTKQLAVILFDKLGLPPLKKTKTGYSTNEATLEKLKNKHPIIEKILEYRELHKLKTTYIEPLLRYAKKDPNYRIYTQFVQTGTATGRLSSKNPNLQNIPIKTEVGREIRYGFVAEEGYELVGIDYSQIELRLLAHFSKDEVLVQAFKEDRDIHLETAIRLFGPKEAQEKRNIAKSINFGLIYGMGSRKLAETLGISPKEAKEIIEAYFASFPSVKSYLESIQSFAKEYGYVQTLLGRRRYFDFSRATGAQLAAFLREATNTLFQGSAADLIKLAMNRIDKELDSNSSMLLQIHDELIFEVKSELAHQYGERFKNIMENIYKLEVPLRCSLSVAKRWGDLK